MDLEMKGSAIVTGAAGGIGSATARALAKQGVEVFLVDLPTSAVDVIADEIRADGGSAEAFVGDMREPDTADAVVAECERVFGGLDYYVNVAGGGTAQTLDSMSPADWHAIVDLNLSAPFFALKAAAPALRRRGGGTVVVVGSLAGLRMSMNNGVSYTAAKAGVLGLVRHAAFELGRDDIRVNAVLPGPVLSPQMVAKLPQQIVDRVASDVPLGRWVQPDEVASAILYFCSSLSSASTGAHLVVDSGQHIGASSGRDEYFARRDTGTPLPAFVSRATTDEG